jgi:hypothetical protein
VWSSTSAPNRRARSSGNRRGRLQPGLALLLALACTLASAQAGGEEVPPIIRKAQEFLGVSEPEKRLRTMVLEGVIWSSEGEPLGELAMLFRRPGSQRVVFSPFDEDGRKTVSRITVVSRDEGFEQIVNERTGRTLKLRTLRGPEVLRMNYLTAEAIDAFTGPLRHHGKIRDEGLVESIPGRPGMTAWSVRFEYPESVDFRHYFNPETGEPIATLDIENNELVAITAHREIDGIRVATRFETYALDENLENPRLLRSVHFNNVSLNTPLDDALFAYPRQPASNP